MAGQRRGELPGLRRRRRSGAPRLFLVLTLALGLLACDGRTRGSWAGFVGVGETGGASSAIAGTWRRIMVVQTQTDVITSETTWIFSAGGGCERTVVSTSLLEGVPRTQRSPCTYQLANGRVTVQFTGTGGPVSFSTSTSGNRLFLDGVEFTRVS